MLAPLTVALVPALVSTVTAFVPIGRTTVSPAFLSIPFTRKVKVETLARTGCGSCDSSTEIAFVLLPSCAVATIVTMCEA